MKLINRATLWVVLLSMLSFTQLFSQNNYYWAAGEKLFFSEDKQHLSIAFHTQEAALQLLSSQQNGISSRRDDLTVEVHTNRPRCIVEMPNAIDNRTEALRELGISSKDVRSISYALKLDDGMLVYLTHSVLVKLSDDMDRNGLDDIMASYNARYVKENSVWVEYDVRNIDQVIPLANYLQEQGFASWASPDVYAKLAFDNDPLYPQQFQMNNTGQTIDGRSGTADIDCDAPEAWGITRGSGSITVAVIDQGLESHPDLDAIDRGFTPVNNGTGTPEGTGSAHGVACAGIIAANHNNIGVRGLAPNVRLRGINIFASGTTASDIGDAFIWAANNGADVISNSWGWPSCTFTNSAVVSGIQYAVNNGRNGDGCVVVFSAGNNNRSCVNFPGNRPEVIAVSAMSQTGARASYSSYGPATDLSAPSSSSGRAGVRTTDRRGSNGYTSGDYYNSFGGTSAACPLVAGAAALVLSVNGNLTEAQVQDILQNSATDMGAGGFDNVYGFGRVNAHQAVLLAQGGSSVNTLVQVRARTRGSGSARMRIRKMANANYQGSNGIQATQTVNTSTTWETYTVSLPGSFGPERVRIYFDNDAGGRDLEVDWIRIIGTTYQTEANDTYSTGTYTSATGCSPGFKRLQILHCNGYLHYRTGGSNPNCSPPNNRTVSNPTSNSIRVNWTAASGASSYDIRYAPSGTTNWQTLNNVPGPSNHTITGLSANVTYTWQIRSNCGSNESAWASGPGFRLTGGSNGDRRVEVRARTRGNGGSARLRVRLMGNGNYQGSNSTLETETIASVSTSWTTYTVNFSRDVTASRIRVYYDNDAANRDVEVDWIRIGGTSFQSEAGDTWATGTWTRPNGCNDAFKRNPIIHCNGYFHYDTNGDNRSNDFLPQTTDLGDEIVGEPFPNPFVDQINVSLPQTMTSDARVTVSLMDAQGRIVYNGLLNQDQIVRLDATLPAGLYILRLDSDDFQKSFKVMKGSGY
ncbi:MAG: S8 family serine peptidase [Bacteroidota bacterium]